MNQGSAPKPSKKSWFVPNHGLSFVFYQGLFGYFRCCLHQPSCWANLSKHLWLIAGHYLGLMAAEQNISVFWVMGSNTVVFLSPKSKLELCTGQSPSVTETSQKQKSIYRPSLLCICTHGFFFVFQVFLGHTLWIWQDELKKKTSPNHGGNSAAMCKTGRRWQCRFLVKAGRAAGEGDGRQWPERSPAFHFTCYGCKSHCKFW